MNGKTSAIYYDNSWTNNNKFLKNGVNPWSNNENPCSSDAKDTHSYGKYPWPIGKNTVIDLSYWYYRAEDPLSIYSSEYMQKHTGN